MSLAASLAKPPTGRAGTRCRLCDLIDTLEGDDKNALTAETTAGTYTLGREELAQRIAAETGADIGADAIGRHRRDTCKDAKRRRQAGNQ